jgi:hypothetical protein
MAEQLHGQTLDYFRRPAKGARMPYDAEFLRWRSIRSLYRVGLWIVIGVPVIAIVPNIMLFGQLTMLAPADFVHNAQTQSVPMVRAIKLYQRDTGQLPDDLSKLVPKYIASVPWSQEMTGGQFMQFDLRYNHRIIYDFTPANEGWSVIGPFAKGPIPLPPVKLNP